MDQNIGVGSMFKGNAYIILFFAGILIIGAIAAMFLQYAAK